MKLITPEELGFIIEASKAKKELQEKTIEEYLYKLMITKLNKEMQSLKKTSTTIFLMPFEDFADFSILLYDSNTGNSRELKKGDRLTGDVNPDDVTREYYLSDSTIKELNIDEEEIWQTIYYHGHEILTNLSFRLKKDLKEAGWYADLEWTPGRFDPYSLNPLILSAVNEDYFNTKVLVIVISNKEDEFAEMDIRNEVVKYQKRFSRDSYYEEKPDRTKERHPQT